MGLRRVVVAVVVAVVAASAVHASAARITLGGQQLAGGNDVVDRCDTSIAAALATTGTTITSVTISDLAAACAGGSLRAVITSSGTVVASVGPTTVPTGGGSMNLAVSGSPSASGVTDVRVVVTGP